jgi:hypothetical protein
VKFLGGLALMAALVTGCGGDSECGDECHGGTRDVRLVWTLQANEAPGFVGSCSGTKAVTTRLEITGPMNITLEKDCEFYQYTLAALDPGSYEVVGTLIDADHKPLTKGKAKASFVVPEAPGTVQVMLDFAYGDFDRSDYKGNWIYTLKWGGATCAAATPPVATSSIRLERGGHAIKTSDGKTIDGASPEPCTDPSIAPQIKNLPWGPAEVTIVGFDASATPAFRQTFKTFVGAGIANPVLSYDVASLTPDAGIPDAAASDAF